MEDDILSTCLPCCAIFVRWHHVMALFVGLIDGTINERILVRSGGKQAEDNESGNSSFSISPSGSLKGAKLSFVLGKCC